MEVVKLLLREHVCHGYFNNPGLRSRQIRGHDGTIWHRTGDLGRIDEKGYLWLVGRVHNAINRGATISGPSRNHHEENSSS